MRLLHVKIQILIQGYNKIYDLIYKIYGVAGHSALASNLIHSD